MENKFYNFRYLLRARGRSSCIIRWALTVVEIKKEEDYDDNDGCSVVGWLAKTI